MSGILGNVRGRPGHAWSQELSDEIRAAAIEKWEHEIVRLEQQVDPASKPGNAVKRSNAVLLIGSSTIRIWRSAAQDMAPYPIINRGYGGAKYSDVAVFAKRLITPHQFTAMVVFVGNDLTGNKDADPSLDQIQGWVRYLIGVAKEHQPDADILLVEVTPTRRRWGVWDSQRKLNAMLREVALTSPGVYFVATAGHVLDPSGKPREELFVEDKLHLNEKGYQLWSSLVLRRLNDVKQLRQDCTCSTPPSQEPQPQEAQSEEARPVEARPQAP